MIELVFFLLIYIFSIFFSLTNLRFNRYIIFITYLSVILVTRLSPPDTDIITYMSSMKSISFQFYYLKEPFVWFLQSHLYSLLKNEVIVFILTDILVFYILYKCLYELNSPLYLYLSVVLIFFVFLGYQNIYRQFFASIFVFYFFVMFYKFNRLSLRSALFAILSHNSSLIFLTSVFSSSKKYLIFIFVCTLPFILLFVSNFKSSGATGRSFEFLYFIIILLYFSFYILLRRFIIKKNDTLFVFLSLCTYSSFCFIFLLSSLSAERLIFYILLPMIILCTIQFQFYFSSRRLWNSINSILLPLPTFVFPSTLSFMSF